MSIKLTANNYHVVVTYLDSNYVWRDFTVEQQYVLDQALSPTEHDISCRVPDFWSHVPRTAHIKHVQCTINGHILRLPWPPLEPQAALDAGQAAPTSLALSFHLYVHDGLNKALATATWQESVTQGA